MGKFTAIIQKLRHIANPTGNPDLRPARMLLEGYIAADTRGLLETRFFKPGSRDERDAWRALARILRGSEPLNESIRQLLADACDPDSQSVRRLHIKNRSTKAKNHFRASQLVRHVWQLRKSGKYRSDAAAIRQTADDFGYSQETISEYWKSLKWLRQLMAKEDLFEGVGAHLDEVEVSLLDERGD